MTNKLYITHCSGKKFPIVRGTPKQLYDSKRIQAFIRQCELSKLPYAIVSGKYGIVYNDDIVDNYDVFLPDKYTNDWYVLRSKIKTKLQERNIEDIILYMHNPIRGKRYIDILKDVVEELGIHLELITRASKIHNFPQWDI